MIIAIVLLVLTALYLVTVLIRSIISCSLWTLRSHLGLLGLNRRQLHTRRANSETTASQNIVEIDLSRVRWKKGDMLLCKKTHKWGMTEIKEGNRYMFLASSKNCPYSFYCVDSDDSEAWRIAKCYCFVKVGESQLDPNKSKDLKVGDKVRILANEPLKYEPKIKGKVGTLVFCGQKCWHVEVGERIVEILKCTIEKL